MPSPPSTPRASNRARARHDALIVRAIESWFAANARDLPWRHEPSAENGAPGRDPYHTLVSELMLQQTQVARVVERFQQFVGRFPTVADLAAADEQDVLALWSGLGYYRRARHLHAAARAVVSRFGSVMPNDPAVLATLPGVGRYTAGAVASMALGVRTPVVDGNVARVLLRVDGGAGLPPDAVRTGDKRAERWAWSRAQSLVQHARRPGRLNEGLMELGALVCTPAPRCDACPIAEFCAARAAGRQGSIPAPKQPAARKSLCCASVIFRDAAGRIAVEQRPARGMWAGLWQAPTLESAGKPPTRAPLYAWITGGARPPRGASLPMSRLDSFVHKTTHRDVSFDVWQWTGPAPAKASWRWLTPDRIALLALSSAQMRVLLPPTP
jgi:A/G-specific adenine glycosylase